MTITDLDAALFSLDAYNHGYNVGINGLDNQIGTATIIDQSDIDPDGEAVNAGFYATAYDVGGQIVISYRGADQLGNIFDADLGDVFGLDFPIIGGDINEAQLRLVVEFYQSIVNTKKKQYCNKTTLKPHHERYRPVCGGYVRFLQVRFRSHKDHVRH